MDRERITLIVTVDLDPIPGSFDSTEKARAAVDRIINDRIPHYNPVVTIPAEK